MDYSFDSETKKITCNCGSVFELKYFLKHIYTLKHMKFYNNLNLR